MSPDPTESAAANQTHLSTHAGIVVSAGIVSIGVLASRLTGLLREVAFAKYFGAGLAFDAYVAAFRIPNLMRDLLAEGALSTAFVTVFSQCLSTKGREEAFQLSNRIVSVLAPSVALICLAAAVFAPQIVDVMFPGYAEVPGKKELTVTMARIMAPFLLMMALAANAMGALNAMGRFAVPALASGCFNVTSLVCGLVIGFVVGPAFGFEPIVGMAWGTLLGGVVQYAVHIPGLRALGLRFRPSFDFSDPDLRQVLRLVGPAVIGSAAVQINVVVNSNFASQISDAGGAVIDGPVGWLGYAFRFMQLPLGLFGVAVASATLPNVSKSAAAGRMDEFRETLSRSLGLVFLLTIPSAVGLIVLRKPIVGAIYEHGEFTSFDTEQTSLALACYCLGLTAYAGLKIVTPSFYALNDVRTPATVAVVSIAANYGLNWTFLRVFGWGHAGLASSTSVVATLNFLVLFFAIRSRLSGVHGRRLLLGLLKIGLSAAAMGVACHYSSALIQHSFGAGFVARLTDIAVSVPLGAAVFWGLCSTLKVPELALATEAVVGKTLAALRRAGYAKIGRGGA